MPNLILCEARFVRTESGAEPIKSCVYDSALEVFTINPNFTESQVRELTEELANELMGSAPPIELKKEIADAVTLEISQERYDRIKTFLNSYNEAARDPENWKLRGFNWKPPADFNVHEHILSHVIYCGIQGIAKEETEISKHIAKLTDIEYPCFKEVIKCPVKMITGVDAWSLYVFRDTKRRPRGRLDKRGGWTRGKPIGRPPKDRGRGRKTTERRKKKKTSYPNPLKGRRVTASPGILDTLRFCAKYGLNPIPLKPKSKYPMKGWDIAYLREEPITTPHLKLFEQPTNIGVAAGYNNVIVVDSDIGVDLEFDTTTVKSRRGYNYVFYTDEPFHKMWKINNKEITVKDYGYIVLPPSIHPDTGKPYEWVRKIKPAYIPKKELINKIEDIVSKQKDVWS